MGWAAIENALMAWVRAATGYDGSHVILAKQNGDRPTDPYALLTLSGPYAVGGPKQYTQDYDAGRASGQEIRTLVNQAQEITVSVEVFSASAVGDGTALELAGACVTALQSPNTDALLSAAGIASKSTEKVRDLSAILNTKFEGRAQFDAVFNALGTLTEYGPYIDTVHAENDIVSPPDTLLLTST